MRTLTWRIPRRRARAVAVTLAALLTATACSDTSKTNASADSTLAQDLALAGQQTAAPAQPTFTDTSVAPTPTPASTAKEAPPAEAERRSAEKRRDEPSRRIAQAPRPRVHSPQPAPAPTPAPVPAETQAPIPAVPGPAPLHGEIGAGTAVALTSGAKVCTSTNLPGDKIVATVNDAITGSNGAVIPAGSTVVLEVASLHSGSTADSAQITFRVRSLVVNDKMYTVAADVAPAGGFQTTKVAAAPNSDRNKVIGGAIAGALLGQLLGHNTKGTIIGAAAGAATGAVVAKSSQKYDLCLPAGAPLRLTLTGPLVMTE